MKYINRKLLYLFSLQQLHKYMSSSVNEKVCKRRCVDVYVHLCTIVLLLLNLRVVAIII